LRELPNNDETGSKKKTKERKKYPHIHKLMGILMIIVIYIKVEFKLIVPTEPQSAHLMLLTTHVNAPEWMTNLFLSQKTFGSAALLFTFTVLR